MNPEPSHVEVAIGQLRTRGRNHAVEALSTLAASDAVFHDPIVRRLLVAVIEDVKLAATREAFRDAATLCRMEWDVSGHRAGWGETPA